jgi:hypothetical protein
MQSYQQSNVLVLFHPMPLTPVIGIIFVFFAHVLEVKTKLKVCTSPSIMFDLGITVVMSINIAIICFDVFKITRAATCVLPITFSAVFFVISLSVNVWLWVTLKVVSCERLEYVQISQMFNFVDHLANHNQKHMNSDLHPLQLT